MFSIYADQYGSHEPQMSTEQLKLEILNLIYFNFHLNSYLWLHHPGQQNPRPLRSLSTIIWQQTEKTVLAKIIVTYVWGWEGSSPKETLSPWISLKHFSQKWYLSARRPYWGELFRSHNTAQAKQRSHQSQQAKEGDGSREQVINGDKDIQWCRFMGTTVWVLVFAIKAKCRQRQAWGRKKKTQNKRRNEGLQGNKKHKSKTRQHKAESQGKAQISIKYLNGITSSKWLQQINKPHTDLYPFIWVINATWCK